MRIINLPSGTLADGDYVGVDNSSDGTRKLFYPANGSINGTVPTGTNLDNVTDPGVYLLDQSNSYTNSPISTNGMLYVMAPGISSARRVQFVVGTTDVYARFKSSSWFGWVNVVTDHRIQMISAASAASHSFTIPNNYQGTLITHNTNTNYKAMYIISCNSSGVVDCTDVKAASNITHSTTTNTLTLTLGSSRAMDYTFINNQNAVTLI